MLQVLTVSAVRVGYNGASRLPPNLKVIQVGYPLYPGALALVEAHCCLAGVPARTKVLACASLPPRGFPDEAWRDPSAASEDHPLYLADELYTTDFGFRGFAEVTSLVERQVQHVAGLEGVNEEQQVLVERTQSEWGQVSQACSAPRVTADRITCSRGPVQYCVRCEAELACHHQHRPSPQATFAFRLHLCLRRLAAGGVCSSTPCAAAGTCLCVTHW